MPTTLQFKPALLQTFRDRVKRSEWEGAKRIALTLGLYRTDPQAIFERDEEYLKRLRRMYSPRRIRAIGRAA